MGNSFLVFEYSFWWILLMVVVAAAIAALPYLKVKYPWNNYFSILLGFLRFTGVLILLFLLVNPLLRQVINRTERPSVAVVFDNSESIPMMMDSLVLTAFQESLREELDKIESRGISVSFISLDEQNRSDDISFSCRQTDLSSSLKKVQEQYEGKNLAALLLITDGIFNRGISPGYLTYPRPIVTLGVGDTIPPKDLAIQTVKSNAIAYQGNNFPVEVIISDEGYEDETKTISISTSGKVLDQQEVETNSRLLFEIEATKPGLTRYTVNIARREGETSYENNTSSFYVDVVEGKERILIVAPAPHPDISAIRKSLSYSDNYETEVFIPGVSVDKPSGEYDVVIEHQAFTRGFPKVELQGNPAKWYILSRKSVIQTIASSTGVTISNANNQKDNVTASFNPLFSAFQLDREKVESFSEFTPVSVPFGEYNISGPVQTLIFQKVGSIVTSRPLLSIFNDGNQKSAFLAGEGFWRWRLLENIENGSNESFDELVNKLIQYLSVRADKRRFRFLPLKSEFSGQEPVRFSSELYNDIFEPLYDYRVDIELQNENGETKSYEYYPTEGDPGLDIGALVEGVYQYKASTRTNGQNFNTSGDFIVKDTNLESLSLTADHDLLRDISNSSGGKFLHYSEIDALDETIESLNAKGIIRSNESFFPLIKSWWLLAIALALFTAEWFLRKYYGSY